MRVGILLVVAFVVLAAAAEDYYMLLGVERAATDDQIKKAFKKLSLKYHPDRNQDDPEAAQKTFMKIATAYDVLSDPEKRNVYNARGEHGVSDFEQQQAQSKSYQEMYKGYWKQNNKQVFPSLYTDTPVLELELSNVDQLYRRKVIWLVNFYHPTCSHCVTFKPEWIAMVSKLAGIMVLAAVNCSSNEELCEEYQIHEYPTILYFPENTAATHERYIGERTYQAISDFAVARMQSFVRLVHKDNFQEFIDTNTNVLKVLLFTIRKTTPPVFKVLSKTFKEKIIFGEVRSTDAELTSRFKVTDFPTVLALTSLDDPEIYAGEGQLEHLEKWLKSFSGKTFEKPLVRELTRSLQKHGHCNKQDPTLCVILFADSEAETIVSTLKEIAHSFNSDPISFFWVNKGKYKEFFDNFGEVAGIVYKAKKMKFMSFTTVETLKDILPNVISGGGTFERLLMAPELTETKIDL